MTQGLDFAAIRREHPIAETIERYIELRRRGGVMVGLCPFHADRTPSFEVVPAKGKAFCNACKWHGDVLDFVAEFESVEIGEAARRLSGNALPVDRPAPQLPPDESEEWTPVLPAPAHAPTFDAAQVYNPRRGQVVNWRKSMTRCDAYLSAAGEVLGYVVRMEIEGKKLTPTVTWARHRDGREAWVSGRFPNPRPLQGLDELARRPDAAVLVVSGEKCREAAARALPGFVAVTWAGGDQNVLRADWTPLQGRRVTLWPDLDRRKAEERDEARRDDVKAGEVMPYDLQSGVEAMNMLAARLAPMTAELRMIDHEPDFLARDLCDGWDVADAVRDGWGTAEIKTWAAARVRTWTPPAAEKETGSTREPECSASMAGEAPADEEQPDPTPSDAVSATVNVEPAQAALEGEIIDLPTQPNSEVHDKLVTWSSLGLSMSDKGVPQPNLDNAARLLERHPEVIGQFWFDEFLGRVLTTWTRTGEVAEWSDPDDVRLALWMQRKLGIGRMAVGTARDAVTAVAMAHTRNECREWLSALKWDGTDRLRFLLPVAFGADANPYTEAVGRCWLVSMVARVMDPGCKVDTMPVFEGPQGIRKSTAMQTLVGARWFAESSESPTSKDFYQVLQGKLLVEIAEMDAFSRAEVNTIKRVITCRVDRYRAPYGRRADDHARMSVFAGTTNKDDWNRDETGARRFWPVACSSVDIEWIEGQREQLFAEAMVRYESGESWWDVPAGDAGREQEARRDSDEWEAVIDTWLVGRDEVSVGDVLAGALRMEAESWDKGSQMRCGKALRALGWEKTTGWRNGKAVKCWVRGNSDSEGGKGGKAEPL